MSTLSDNGPKSEVLRSVESKPLGLTILKMLIDPVARFGPRGFEAKDRNDP